MPLIEGKSPKSFSHNVRAEMHSDKPLKQSLAIAYAMKRKAQKRDRKEDDDNYADGGMVDLQRVEESDYPERGPDVCPDCESGHCSMHGADMMEHGGDVVDRIMHKGMKKMSEGGRVANDDFGPEQEDMIGFKENEFDDLPLRDDLEQHYTGANSGDELDNEEQEEDRHDIVGRIMRSLGKKDRMPIAGYGMSYGRNK